MTSNVIDIIKEPALVCVCECGCASFSILSDGSAKCAHCDIHHDDADGSWVDQGATKSDVDELGVFLDVHGNGSVEFAKARIGGLAADDDVRLVVVAKDGGSLHAWCAAESTDQLKWVDEKLKSALTMITNSAKGINGSEDQ